MISGAGRIDWTTFVDFTNLAAAGERRGWRTVCGTQSLESREISQKNAACRYQVQLQVVTDFLLKDQMHRDGFAEGFSSGR